MGAQQAHGSQDPEDAAEEEADLQLPKDPDLSGGQVEDAIEEPKAQERQQNGQHSDPPQRPDALRAVNAVPAQHLPPAAQGQTQDHRCGEEEKQGFQRGRDGRTRDIVDINAAKTKGRVTLVVLIAQRQFAILDRVSNKRQSADTNAILKFFVTCLFSILQR